MAAASFSGIVHSTRNGFDASQVETTVNPSTTGDPPDAADFPIGFVQFDVTGISPGGTVDVRLILESPQVVNSYYKFDSTSFFEFNNATFIDGVESDPSDDNGLIDAIRLTFVDGGAGDLDGSANGVIVDPGAPAFNPASLVDPITGRNNAVTAQTLSLATTFTDQGTETHSATIDWGDGTIEGILLKAVCW